MWIKPRRSTGALLSGLFVAIFVLLAVRNAAQRQAGFAADIQALSEPGGTFDTDNLISNERSYEDVIPALRRAGPGGAYIGVGPDQNFSYIAAVRPAAAYIIDVRRDNLLLHLLFKALFAISDTRAEYLFNLMGRRPPDGESWRATALRRITAAADAAPRQDPAALQARIDAALTSFGMPLSPQDIATVHRFHQSFVNQGLDLKFVTFGRSPQYYYPTYRDLLFATDGENHSDNFLQSEDDFQFVRRMERQDLIIPVVGNLAGPSALAAVGRAIRTRGLSVTAFYVSNVEFYLFRNGTFQSYADTVGTLPRTPRSVMVRSIFNGGGSVSVTQSMDDFVAHRYGSYGALAF